MFICWYFLVCLWRFFISISKPSVFCDLHDSSWAHYKLFIRGSKRKVLEKKLGRRWGSPENLVVFCLGTNPPPTNTSKVTVSQGLRRTDLWLYEVGFSWAAATKRCRKKRGGSHPVCTVGALLTGEDCHHFRDELYGLELPTPWCLVPHIHQSLVCAPKVLAFFGMESRQETKKSTVKIQHPINLVTSQII